MEDQFGGRTDDDLFADEFEPVETDQAHQPDPKATPPVASAPDPSPAPAPAPAPAQVSTAADPEVPTTVSSSTPQPAASGPVATGTPPTAPAADGPRSLSQSIHAHQQPPASTPRGPRNHRSNHPSANTHNNKQAPANSSPNPASPSTTQAPSNQQPNQAPSRPHGPRNASNNNAARMSSGANPRTKLTEDELAKKMEQMKLLNAEKTKQFEQAEKDRESHNIALEKANEDAKKRRAEEFERRRREAVDRRQMDDERERNRERKLKAMEAKAGGSWDEGKEERLLEEDRKRGGFNFRGANGGIRGAASRGSGLSGSRFSAPSGDTDFMSGRAGGSGRGRGGRGRGGRGGSASRDDFSRSPAQQISSPAPPKDEDFPALPKSAKSAPPKSKAAETVAKVELASPLSPVGNWDVEMEAQDAQRTSGDAGDKATNP